MGMYLSMCAVTEKELKKIEKNPDLLEEFLDSDKSLNIDKAWHAIHFILTGETWDNDNVLDGIILTGNLVGEEGDEDYDVGYGPATYLTENDVSEIAQVLSKIDLEKLRTEFSLSMFSGKDIYVFSDIESVEDEDEDEDEEKDYIFEYLENLITYFNEAATNKKLMIKMIM